MRSKVMLVTFLFLMVLIAAKIMISGYYLHFDALKVPGMNIAIVQEDNVAHAAAKEADAQQSSVAQTSVNDLVATATELRKKEQELKEREAAVIKKEQELAPLQAEIDAKIEQLNELQETLTAMAKEIAEKEQTLQDEKITHLVSLYSNMDASKAARIMDKLDMDTVVKILGNMRGKSAGQILAAMSAEKGAVISEKLSKTE